MIREEEEEEERIAAATAITPKAGGGYTPAAARASTYAATSSISTRTSRGDLDDTAKLFLLSSLLAQDRIITYNGKAFLKGEEQRGGVMMDDDG